MEFIFDQFFYYGITGTQVYFYLAMGGIIALVVVWIFVVVLLKGLRFLFKRRLDLIVLQILVPKYSGEEAEQGVSDGPKSQQELAERLAKAEAFFSSISSLVAQKGIGATVRGRNDYYSFEVVLKDGLIYYYIAIPRAMVEYTVEQVVSQYPNAVIEPVDDYNIFNAQGVVIGAEMKFKKEYIFPLKTYKTMEVDGMSAITTSLSQLPEGSGAVIQFLTRSAHPKWHNWGQQTASKAFQGVKLKEAIKKSKSIDWKGKGILGGLMDGIGAVIATTWEQLTGDKGDPNRPQMAGQNQEERYTLTQKEQEVLKGIEEKAAKTGVEANLRIVVSAKTKVIAQAALDNIVNSLYQFNIFEFGNALVKTKPRQSKLIKNFIDRQFNEENVLILNAEEAATIFHLPMGYLQTPNIVWLQSKTAPSPTNIPKSGLLLGYNKYRGKEIPIYIKEEDRRRHMYIIGMTGTGKSKFIDSMLIRDIQAGYGVCFIDPHGDDVDIVLENIPKERRDDVVYFDPSDTSRPFGINMLEYDYNSPEDKIFVVNQVFEIFDKLYDLKSTGGPMFEQYMKNACMLIMDDPDSGSTLMEISRVLADDGYRAYKLSKCRTQVVKDFWEKEAQKAGGEASLQNMVPYITSKLAPFIANDLVRPIISQQKTTLDFIDAMNTNKIVLVKLSKGKIGDINANLLGMIIIGKILQAAFARADIPEEERKDFFLYIDEFQNFLTDSIKTILSEARKYRLGLIIAHQLLGQLEVRGDDSIKKTIFGNVGTKVAFRIGVEDSEFLAEEFKPVFGAYDFMNMPKFNCAVKLLIDNANPPPFSMAVPWLGGWTKPDKAFAQELRELSKQKYGMSKEAIEEEIQRRRAFGEAMPGAKKEITLEDLFG